MSPFQLKLLLITPMFLTLVVSTPTFDKIKSQLSFTSPTYSAVEPNERFQVVIVTVDSLVCSIIKSTTTFCV